MNRHMRTARSHNKGGKRHTQYRVHQSVRRAKAEARFAKKKRDK